MKQKQHIKRKLFLYTLQLSALTFGGGYVIVSLMRKQFVEKLGWITEEEMLDITAIAQSAPGPIAVNGSILLGYRVAGVAGAAAAIAGTVLPPLVILSLISLVYQVFQTNTIVKYTLKGMQAGVAAVMADVVISMTGGVLKSRSVLWCAVMLISFVLSAFFDVNVMYLIFASGVIGIVYALFQKKRGGACKR